MMKMMMIGFGTLNPSSSSSSTTKIILEDFHFRSGTSEIVSSVPRKTLHHLKFLRLDSVQNKTLKLVPLRSSSIEVSQVNSEAAETEAVENFSRKTVRVRFQMQKECVFGEHFFILGDDSVFGGLWDPETALPMNWSDGHVWTIDLDLPVGRLVEYKFILKAKTGEFLWQPGPNRSVETWETNKIIRVCEDWENADLQMMIEEDFVPIVAENNTQPQQSVKVNTGVSLNEAEEENEVLSAVEKDPLVVVVGNAGYVSDESEEEKIMESSNGALTAREGNVTKEAMSSEEECPVLVPGLFPMSDMENEEVSEPSTHVSGEVLNEGKAKTFPEVDKKKKNTRGGRNKNTKVKAISVFENSEQEEVNNIKQRDYNAAEEEEEKEMQQEQLEEEPLETPHVVIENDIQWGRRTLSKLLSNLGLF